MFHLLYEYRAWATRLHWFAGCAARRSWRQPACGSREFEARTEEPRQRRDEHHELSRMPLENGHLLRPSGARQQVARGRWSSIPCLLALFCGSRIGFRLACARAPCWTKPRQGKPARKTSPFARPSPFCYSRSARSGNGDGLDMNTLRRGLRITYLVSTTVSPHGRP